MPPIKNERKEATQCISAVGSNTTPSVTTTLTHQKTTTFITYAHNTPACYWAALYNKWTSSRCLWNTSCVVILLERLPEVASRKLSRHLPLGLLKLDVYIVRSLLRDPVGKERIFSAQLLTPLFRLFCENCADTFQHADCGLRYDLNCTFRWLFEVDVNLPATALPALVGVIDVLAVSGNFCRLLQIFRHVSDENRDMLLTLLDERPSSVFLAMQHHCRSYYPVFTTNPEQQRHLQNLLKSLVFLSLHLRSGRKRGLDILDESLRLGSYDMTAEVIETVVESRSAPPFSFFPALSRLLRDGWIPRTSQLFSYLYGLTYHDPAHVQVLGDSGALTLLIQVCLRHYLDPNSMSVLLEFIKVVISHSTPSLLDQCFMACIRCHAMAELSSLVRHQPVCTEIGTCCQIGLLQGQAQGQLQEHFQFIL